MSTTLLHASVLVFLATLSGLPRNALAQASSRSALSSPPGREQAAIARPDRTTATYGDWVLGCEFPPGGGEANCEVMQTILDQRSQPLAHIVARRAAPPAQAPVTISAQVGISATVAEPLRLAIEGQPPISLAFRRCSPRGCIAETQASGAEFGMLVQRTESAKIEYLNGDGQALSIPVSLRGLAIAIEALRSPERR